MSTPHNAVANRSNVLLIAIAFFGVFIYGLLAALPGSVLPTLERNGFIPDDTQVSNFLFINAVGSLLAYIVSGPVIDRMGKKTALAAGALLTAMAMAGFAFVVTRVAPASALVLMFVLSLIFGFGANAIVAAAHALVTDAAATWRNSALNLLDVFFGLGLAILPQFVTGLQVRGGLSLVFWILAAFGLALLAVTLAPRFPVAAHATSHSTGGASSLFRNVSFLLLALGLFMYVGAEVSVGKWIPTFMQRDAQLLAASGVDAAQQATLDAASPAARTNFFEQNEAGKSVVAYGLSTLSYFGFALIAGRLVASLLLGVMRVNGFVLLTGGSILTAVALAFAFTADVPSSVRLSVIVAGFGMGPIFPTSVGLASVMLPRAAGTAISLAMGIGFAGPLLIPPAVGYISSAAGGEIGDIRTGLLAVLAAAIVMALLHVALILRERRRASLPEDQLEMSAAANAD